MSKSVTFKMAMELLGQLGTENELLLQQNERWSDDCTKLLHWGIRLAEALKQIAALEPGCSTAELCEDCACNVARKLAREALEGER